MKDIKKMSVAAWGIFLSSLEMTNYDFRVFTTGSNMMAWYKIVIPPKVGLQWIITINNFLPILMTMILSNNNNTNKKTNK